MPIDLSDVAQWPDTTLEAARQAILAERDRRSMVRVLPGQINDFIAIYQGAVGLHQTPGEPWAEPTGRMDTYSADFQVTHQGQTWIALRDGVTSEPGADPSGWTPAPN